MAVAIREIGAQGFEEGAIRRIKVPLEKIDSIAYKIDPLVKNDRINASSAQDRFSRPFGRDFATTALQLLDAHRFSPNGFMGRIVPATLNMITWIAKEDIPEAGIEKGKMFHEKGTIQEGYPYDWYINKDGLGENYDTADATDLTLILLYELSLDNPTILDQALPYIKRMGEWVIRNTREYGGAAYVGAKFDPKRKFKGLHNHCWKDNEFYYVNEKGEIPVHPIYPVREQGFRYASLIMLGQMLQNFEPEMSKTAKDLAYWHKKWFMKKFPYHDEKGAFLADALDGNMNPMTNIKSCDAIAAISTRFCIIDDSELRREIIKRSFEELYDERIGLKTVSQSSLVHPKNFYHGKDSAWPQVQGFGIRTNLLEEERLGSEHKDFRQECEENAIKLAEASLRMSFYYGDPVETAKLGKEAPYEEYIEYDEEGRIIGRQCKIQAWTGSENQYASNLLKLRGVKEIEVFSRSVAA